MAYALILALAVATALMFYALYTRIRHLEGLLTAHLDLHDTKERQYEANAPTSTQVRSLETRVRDLDAALRLGTVDSTGARGYVEPRGYLEGNVQMWKRAYDEQQQKRLEACSHDWREYNKDNDKCSKCGAYRLREWESTEEYRQRKAGGDA